MPKVAILHHTATTNNYAPQDVPAIIRSIYAFHVEAEDWCDVGYNFLVDRFGRIWEGRYGGIDKPVLGAHAGGFNTNTFGVGMIGTFDQCATHAGDARRDSPVDGLEALRSRTRTPLAPRR